MQVRYFYRYEGKQKLILCGHFTKKEVRQLLKEDWKESLPRSPQNSHNKQRVTSSTSRKRKVRV